ncbi:MAG: hypothetical protein ABIU84_00470, partial [Thermoanaerobaculia bacterium]
MPTPAPPVDLPAGLPASPGDAVLVEAAVSFLAPPAAPQSCGPYRLFTDLTGARLERILGLCQVVAAG